MEILTETKKRTKYDNQIRSIGQNLNSDSETFIFGADKVFVGVEDASQKEIAISKNGFKYERNKVNEVKIYDLNTTKNHNWFVVDFETGGRGWYPGSKEIVRCKDTILYTLPDDTSEVIAVFPNEEKIFDKIDLVYGKSSQTSANIIYCKIMYEEMCCYIKSTAILETKFIDRES